jgi:tRNA1(Val) A37 N6-methylase TrmN6
METSADLGKFCCAACNALNPANPNAFVAIIHDAAQLPRVLSELSNAGLTVLESRIVLHRAGVPTGRVLVRARLSLCGDEMSDATAPVVEPLLLHPEDCRENLYSEDIESFLDALASPIYSIGRNVYAGSDRVSAKALG